MALEYTVEPRKLSNDEVIAAEPGKAEFYGVYARGITAFYGVGEGGPDSKYLLNHLSDFPDQASAQAFSQHLQDNAPALEAWRNSEEPVTVAGVRYSLSESGEHYVADGSLAAGYQTPTVWTWEIRQYLEMGVLTPELAANATTHPENLAGLNDFDKQALLNFAASTQQDPSFSDFRKLETEFYRREGAYIPKGVNFRAFTIDDMPKCLREFVWNPAFPPKVVDKAADFDMRESTPQEFVRQPDLSQNKDEWQDQAHEYMDRALTHLGAVAHHPAVIEYQNINNMPNMPERAKAIYADTLLRNNPDLREHYAQITDSLEKVQNAAFMMKNGGLDDSAILEKASKVKQTAGQLPDIEASASSGLFSKLASFFTEQQGQTMRKP